MKPPPERVLEVAAQRLEHFARESPTAPSAPELTWIAAALIVVAREWDGAVVERLESAAQFEVLLERGRQLLSAGEPDAGTVPGSSPDVRAEGLRCRPSSVGWTNRAAPPSASRPRWRPATPLLPHRLLAALRTWELEDARRQILVDSLW